MTEELKQKAEEYLKAQCLKRKDCLVLEMPDHYITDVRQAYIDGATENGIQWHDLRKGPNDLPKDTYDVLDQAGYKVHYNFFQNVWVNEKDEIDNQVIAWCEIPQFKGE